MELTKEHFDQIVSGLATKNDLHGLATSEELNEVSVQIGAVQETLANHTATLASISKETKDTEEEMILVRNRQDRQETAIKTVADKLQMDVMPLLH